MPIRIATGMLALLWLVGFSVLIGVGYVMQSEGRIASQSFQSFLDQMIRAFEPYVALVLAFLFSSHRAGRANEKCKILTFLVAVAATGGWIAMVTYNVLEAAAGRITIQVAMVQIDQVISRMAWLVAPIMGYYFGDRTRGSQSR